MIKDNIKKKNTTDNSSNVEKCQLKTGWTGCDVTHESDECLELERTYKTEEDLKSVSLLQKSEN